MLRHGLSVYRKEGDDMLLYACDRCGQFNVTREFLTYVTLNAYNSKYTKGTNNVLSKQLCAKCVHELEDVLKVFMKGSEDNNDE